MMDKMARWLTGAAKQQFSEVLRRSAEEPQMIYRRGRLVAAVISADAFAELQRSREERLRRTLGQRFDEVRELASRYDYELDTGDRSDRAAGFDGS
jgi:prevent-host-death family protein